MGANDHHPSLWEGSAMTAVSVAIVVTLLTFAGGLLGLYLQRALPDQHSVEKSRDMIGSVMGLVTLLLALVLGTIVGSAYFFSATQQSELQALSAQAIQLDEALAQFGPEAKPPRDAYKANLGKNLQLFWGGGEVDPAELHVSKAMAAMSAFKGAVRSLDAKTPEQKAAVAGANAHLWADRTDPLVDVPAARQSVFQAAADCRGVLVVLPVLRLRPDVAPQRDDARRPRVRRLRCRQRDLPNPRTQSALHRPLPHFAGGARADGRLD